MSLRKLYIDSRWAAPGGRASNFKFQLPATIVCEEGTVLYVTDVMVPMSWRTVTPANRRLYFIERDGATYQRRVAEVAPGSYTAQSLAEALQTALDAAAAGYTVSYDAGSNRMTVAGPNPWIIVPTEDLRSEAWYKSNWIGSFLGTPGPAFDFSAPGELNGLLGVPTPSAAYDQYPYAAEHTLGVVDIRSHTALYLHSEALSTYQAIAPNGSRSCIKRIPVTQGFGSVIQEGFSGCVWDYLDAEGLSLGTIDVRLLDVYGQEVDLQGGHLNFALVFGKRPG